MLKLRFEPLERRELLAAAVGVDDSYSLDEDTFLLISGPGVLGNDVDLTPTTVAELSADVSHGALMLDEDGSFIYVPDTNWTGEDSFAYVATDPVEGTSEITICVLNVLPMNDVPIAVDDAYDVDEDQTLNVTTPWITGSGILANDIDIDGDVLTAVWNSGPNFGSLVLNNDGTFTYVPDPNYHGPDQFAYQVDDGAGGVSNIGIVSLTVHPVNDDPIALANSYVVDEDEVLNVSDITGVLNNDTDVDGDTLTAVVLDGPEKGSLTLNDTGSFTYTPNENFHGADSFTYTAADGNGGTAVAVVNITVASVNDVPLAADDNFTGLEDNLLHVADPGVLMNDSDIDGDALTAVKDADPANGTVVLNADGSFDYTPNPGFFGADAFTYHAEDGNGGLSAVRTVYINILENHDPIPVNDVYTVNEDVLLSRNVLDNDTDPDPTDVLTVSDNTDPANGTLIMNANGGFIYVPNPDFNGTDSFTYTASDGVGGEAIATVNITITPVNDAPVSATDPYSTSKNVAVSIKKASGVLANDTDVDGDALSAVLVSGPTQGTLYMNNQGAFIYIPNTDYVGADEFTYEAFDGTEATATTVTINIIDSDAPIARDNLYVQDVVLAGSNYSVPEVVGVLANDYLKVPGDAEGELTVVSPLVQDVSHGVLTILDDGSFDYTPEVGFEGADTFVYRATNGTLETGDATVTIVVRHNEALPAEPEGGFPEIGLSIEDDGLGNGVLTITPPEGGWGDFTGDIPIKVTVTDIHGASDSDIFVLTVVDGEAESLVDAKGNARAFTLAPSIDEEPFGIVLKEDWLNADDEYDYWSDPEFVAAFHLWSMNDADTQKRRKENQAAFEAWLTEVSY